MYWNLFARLTKVLNVLRLIETWDVLKCLATERLLQHRGWLIETWDVLKCDKNRFQIIVANRLIETWDVLKFLPVPNCVSWDID